MRGMPLRDFVIEIYGVTQPGDAKKSGEGHRERQDARENLLV